MRLKTARVTEFRSVRDSQVFDVGQVTCLVGRNESGKTALLQALYRLNPIVPQRAQFDVTEDYPRSYVKRYERAVKAGDIEPQVVVEAHFALDAEEVSSIEGIFGEGALPTRELVLSKDYANNLTTTLEVNEGLAISHVANKTTLELHVREALLANPTFEQLVQSFVANAQAVNERRTAATAQANALTDAQAKQAALAEANAIQEPSGTKKWREWAEQNKAKTLAETADARRLIRAAGARVLFLPPYSPDLNPIELCWSKLKALLREFGARTRDALDDAIRRAMDLIDRHDASAWFAHCGYSGQL